MSRRVVFVDSLPRNSLGKLLKTELRRNFYNPAGPEEKVPGAKR
jgi:acyl-CoA synthetase (AMP-forming)/AMP-acid ligase II